MLEQLYPINLIKKNPFYALFLGLSYGIVGIGLSVLLFPEDPALVAVALIALMSYPTITSLMKEEESIESTKNEFNIFVFLKDHKYVFIIYLLFFLGLLLAFSVFALLLPSLATNHIFENQIGIYGKSGEAISFSYPLFMDLLANNFMVLVVIFLTAFLLGDGGLFLIIWNASVWGTIFGNLAKNAALNTNNNPFLYFAIILAIVFPHMMLEAFCYVASATTGGVISRAMIKEKILSRRFNLIIVNTVISLIFAIVVLLIAVTVETFVLNSATIYRKIILESFS